MKKLAIIVATLSLAATPVFACPHDEAAAPKTAEKKKDEKAPAKEAPKKETTETAKAKEQPKQTTEPKKPEKVSQK